MDYCHGRTPKSASSWKAKTEKSEMGFGDLKTESGVQILNDFLADKSYIEGYL